ncbi:MAG: hypothetical protein IPO91_23755 [Chloroflexi bacterium]|nr:hypothetical protein [Chloroflexota bacterium]
MTNKDVPTPDLRIVPTASLKPHEEHDSQRSLPLIESLKTARYMINPPLVAPMGNGDYVILDGANRAYCFSALDYPHILVQVASYESGLVDLDNWQHVVAGWNIDAFLQQLRAMPEIRLAEGDATDVVDDISEGDADLALTLHEYHPGDDDREEALAQMYLQDGRVVSIYAPNSSLHERNAALRKVVAVYQKNAALHRTTLVDTDEVWSLYPDAIALVIFARYTPRDIIAAARIRVSAAGNQPPYCERSGDPRQLPTGQST